MRRVWAVLVVLAGSLVLPAPHAVAESSPAPATTSQLVTVATTSASATTGTLTAWQRDASGDWQVVLGPVTAHVGAQGVGQASEGSSRTPAGAYPLTETFGRTANPGTRMPWFTSTAQDWWDENPASATYNTHVRRTGSPGGASENLLAAGAVYDDAAVIGYNRARTPGAGSGFFLHVTNGAPTAGCVAIDRAPLVALLRWLDPARAPTILLRVGPTWSPPPAHGPRGHLDGGTLVGNRYTLAGWALDPDAPQQPLFVDVYDVGPTGTRRGTRTTAGGSRPDVGRAYPGTGTRHGELATISLPGSGVHTVCAYAINVGPGTGNPVLGCRTVTVGGSTGSLDAVTVEGGVLRVAGWAADPQAAGAPLEVHVYVTGPRGRVGTPGTTTGGERPDVARAVPWAGARTGFAARVPNEGAGTNQVCVYAISAGSTGNPLLGCRNVTVS